MRECWAKVLGGCGGGISGEHLVSKGLFRGPGVQVQGSIWKATEPRTIGINSLTANVLCRDHNSALSPVDDAGKNAFQAIRRFEEILSGRSDPQSATDMAHVVDGVLLERWFIKHAINLFVASKHERTWYDGSERASPPSDLVESAFGVRPLEKPRGLYNWAGLSLGERKVVADQIAFLGLHNAGSQYVGALFEFQSLSFLIWFDGKSSEAPWPHVRQYFHHMGGFFDAPPKRASFEVRWT